LVSAKDLRRIGGMPCIDFANTLDWRGRAAPVEYLRTFDDVLGWSVAAGVISEQQGAGLRHVSKATAEKARAHTIAFREAIYRLLKATVNGAKPDPSDVQRTSAVIAQARTHLSLRYERGSFGWTFVDTEGDTRLPLWAISLSLGDLITSEKLRHVRECGGPECGWLFLDTTKNRQRRWCSMDGCGNRAKARRHYARVH
jgi:predicted RNA-binding Zn ribbon-like protein